MPNGNVLIHGNILQFTRNNGRLEKIRRWAYIAEDSLFIFPDSRNSSSCYKLYLSEAEINVSYLEDVPWISITEPNNITYFIQPEKTYKFQKWLSAFHKATKHRQKSSDSSDFPPRGLQSSRFVPSPSLDTIRSNSTSRTPLSYSQASLNGNIESSVIYNNEIVPPTPPRKKHPHSHRSSNLTENGKSHSKRDLATRDRRDSTSPSSTRPASSRQMTKSTGNQPPPLPPRSARNLRTVKEHPDMRDEEVLDTKPLGEIRNRYPVSGLAKRMSICASDLLGKSRDELILLLLQLNREKANLQRWYEYFMQQVELIREAKGNSPEAEQEIAAIENELCDVTGQLHLSEPLVKFLGNMLRMGDMFHGDDVMFASEYREHLLPPELVAPRNESLNFAREVEARDVAQALDASRAEQTSRIATGTQGREPVEGGLGQDDLEGRSVKSDRSRLDTLTRSAWTESETVRIQRSQLEEELAKLDELCAPHKVLQNEFKSTQDSIQTSIRQTQKQAGRMSGPSSSLLRRLKSNPDSRTSGIFDEYVVSSRTTTPKQRSTSQEPIFATRSFTQLGHPSYTTDRRIDKDREQGIQRFRSIPDHLHLLTEAGYPIEHMQPLSSEWKVQHNGIPGTPPNELFSLHSPKPSSTRGWDRPSSPTVALERNLEPRQRRTIYTSFDTPETPRLMDSTRTSFIQRRDSSLQERPFPEGGKYERYQRSSLERGFDQLSKRDIPDAKNGESTIYLTTRQGPTRKDSARNSDSDLARSIEQNRPTQITESEIERTPRGDNNHWERNAPNTFSGKLPSEEQYKLKDETIYSETKHRSLDSSRHIERPVSNAYSASGMPQWTSRTEKKMWTEQARDIPDKFRVNKAKVDRDEDSLSSLKQGWAQHSLRDALLEPETPTTKIHQRAIPNYAPEPFGTPRSKKPSSDSEESSTLLPSQSTQRTQTSSQRAHRDVLRVTRRQSIEPRNELAPENIDRVFEPPQPVLIETRYAPTPPMTIPDRLDSARRKRSRIKSLQDMLLRQSMSNGSYPEHHHRPEERALLLERKNLIHLKQVIASQAADAFRDYASKVRGSI